MVAQILFVSNDLKNRENISSRLRYQQDTILQTSSGLQALSLIENEKIDLVLLTDTMDEIRPAELISLIRDSSSPKDLHIMLVIMKKSVRIKVEELQEVGLNSIFIEAIDKFNDLNVKIQNLLENKK